MRRLRTIAAALVVWFGLLVGGAAVLTLSGCNLPEDEMYSQNTEWNAGRQRNAYKKYAFAYIGMVLLGAFVMWTVCKSSKRSVVKAGDEKEG